MRSKDGISFACIAFRPAEAAEMTGLSALMQRDWRDRGFLPPAAGHARYDVFDIARMFIMRSLSDAGMGPKFSNDFSQKGANALVYHLLRVTDAYENWDKYLKNQNDIEDIRSSLIDEEYRFVYMVLWANQQIEFCDDIGEAFCREHPTLKGHRFLRQDGPVTVFNLEYMSARLCARAPRPFIRLLGKEEAGKLGRSPRR